MYIDTHEAVKTLTKGKVFTDKQAERLIQVVADSNREISTKKDIDQLDNKFSSEFKLVRTEIKSTANALEVRMIKYMLANTIAILGAILALIFAG